jgi:PAS domain-containing protein
MAKRRVAAGRNRATGEPKRIVAMAHAENARALAAPPPGDQRYKALVQASASIVWRAAPDGSIIEAWGWDQFADRPCLGFLGRRWRSVVHPDDRDRVDQHWTTTVAKGENTTIDFRVRQPDGGYRWANARAIVLRDAAGRTLEWIGTVTDIQDQKHSEQALREREELLRLAVEATGLGIWDMELPSRATQWSSSIPMTGPMSRTRSRKPWGQ